MIFDRAALVEQARISIAVGSKSFAAASRLFDRETRERAWLLYAWCRACDDIADGQQMGHGMRTVPDAPQRITDIRGLTTRALDGGATGAAAFDALGVVAAECGIPHHLPFDVIEGFALDAADWRPASEGDLYLYCYHVAGAVGVMMAIVMGVAPDDDATLDRACDLGIAFQLANIARDIGEDAAAGRCYIPADWLAEAGIASDAIMADSNALATIGRKLADRAAAYEASARTGAAALPYRSAWAVLAAAGIYGDIARRVARRGSAAWDHRVTTSRAEKFAWIIRAGGEAALRRSFPPKTRERLWTRPHASSSMSQ